MSQPSPMEVHRLQQALQNLALVLFELKLTKLSSDCASGSELLLRVRDSYDSLVPEIGGLYYSICSELVTIDIFAVNPTLKDFYALPNLFGNSVNEAFPSAREDIQMAGNCISFGLNTAAVFHLMRVSEVGLKAFARRLKVDKAQLKKPIDQSMWGPILDKAAQNIETIKKSKSHHSRQGLKRLEFYEEVHLELVAIKDVWRNRVSHSRSSYSSKDALRIHDRVRDFMVKLAERVSEPKPRKLKK